MAVKTVDTLLKTFPETMIISTSWNKCRIDSFLKRLGKGSIFGYSGAFTLQEITAYARGLDVGIGVLPLSNPLRKKYGEYVLRVTKPYTNPSGRIAPVSVSFENIYYMTRKMSPGNRTCKGDKCSNAIAKGEEFLEVTDLVEIFGRRGYKKLSLCSACAAVLVKSKIKQLLRVSCLSTKKINTVLKTVEKL
jgi:hypothetical protein